MRPFVSLLLLCTVAIAQPAFGSETETLFSGANPEPWNFMREASRLTAEFNRCTMEYGLGGQTIPVPACVDGEVQVCGRLKDGHVGLALKQYADWTSVFSAAPTVPAQVLRALAEQAGVHLYIDSYDVLWATRGMLALSVDQPGPRTVRLPVTANVTDLFDGKSVGMSMREFTVDMPAMESKIWRIDPAHPN